MFSRIPESTMRWVRTGLLVAWFVLIASLFWDPVTPHLTMPDNLASPFHLHAEAPPVMVQGHPLPALPYAMGNRIFWTMVLPLVPIFLMVFGHEAWRRICPLSHFSQIPHMLGWQRKIKALNRRSGGVERVLALLPQGWLWRNHYYLQLGFLTAGVCARILFDNADRAALIAFARERMGRLDLLVNNAGMGPREPNTAQVPAGTDTSTHPGGRDFRASLSVGRSIPTR